MPKIRCQCQKILSFKPEQGGKLVTCPSCSTKLRLPTLSKAATPVRTAQDELSGPDNQISATLDQLESEPLPDRHPSKSRLGETGYDLATPPEQPAHRPPTIAPQAKEPPLRKLPEPERVPSFWRLLPSVFSYPIRGNGGIALIVGIVFFTVARLVLVAASFFPIVGIVIALVIGVVILGLFVGYLMSIMLTSSEGEEEAPDWPDLTDYQEDALKPFLFMIALTAISIGPAIAYGQFVDHGNAVLGLSLLAAGVFYMPMGLLCIALLNDIAALNPILVIRAICGVFGKYLVAWVLTALCFAAYLVMDLLVANLRVPILGSALQLAITFYFGFAGARVLGLLYYTSRDELDWLAG